MAGYIAEVWVRQPDAKDEADPYRSFWSDEFGAQSAARRWARAQMRLDPNATSADIHIVDDDGDWHRVESLGL